MSLRAYREVIVFTKPPIAAQRLMFPPLALLGRAMGRRPSYPEYAYSDETVELDPTALALLDADGRLIFSTAVRRLSPGSGRPLPRRAAVSQARAGCGR